MNGRCPLTGDYSQGGGPCVEGKGGVSHAGGAMLALVGRLTVGRICSAMAAAAGWMTAEMVDGIGPFIVNSGP